MKSKIPFYALFALTLGSGTSLWAQEKTPSKPGPAKTAKVEPPKEVALDGELRLDGKITVFLGTGNWVVQVVSWTSPKGVTTNFDDLKNKTILLNSDAFIHARSEWDKVPLSEVTVGARVAVIGKNQPDGSVKVREVVLLEGYGAQKKIGSLSTNRESLLLINQSRAARDAGQISRAIELAKRAVEIAQGQGDYSGEALASQDMGNLYSENGQLDLAMQYYTREETLGKTLSNPLATTFGKLGRAGVLASTGELSTAIEILQEAVPISLSTPAALQIDVLELLARCYVKAGQTSDGIGVLEKLHPLEAANGELEDSYGTRASIAMLRAKDEPDEARTILDQLAPNVPNINNDTKRANTNGIIGIALWRMGEKEAAAEYFQKAAQTLKDAGVKGADRWETIAKKLAESDGKDEDALDALDNGDATQKTDKDETPGGPTA
jgi:tetratricopeptide (TPR) repeat protein